MNPINFAFRRPCTVIVVILGIVLGSVMALLRMPIDIFPNLNLPVIYVIQAYGGMDPAQMEGLITNYYEYHFLYISGIHHVESRNIQGLSLMKLYFHPGTDMAQAMAETIAYVNRSRSFMPPGTVPPYVVRFDTGSVPVGYLVLSSKTRSIGEIQDLALFRVRPMFASLPGVSAPPPFGGNQRTLVVQVDPDRMRSYNLSPDDVVAALKSGNSISPSGNARIKDQMPIVPVNSMVRAVQELGNIPLRLGENVYLRDVAKIEDGTDIPAGHTLVNGRPAIFMLVTKRADASTLTVVNEVKASLPKMKAVLPQDIDVRFEFDQSPYVTHSIEGVVQGGLARRRPYRADGALVPARLAHGDRGGPEHSLCPVGRALRAVGGGPDHQPDDTGRSGVGRGHSGRHVHGRGGKHSHSSGPYSFRRAGRPAGNRETGVPRLLAMLCILAVFLPSFFMEGAAREMFVPLSLAVGFAMVAAYLLSSTFVPVMAVWLFRSQLQDHAGRAVLILSVSVRLCTGLGAMMPWRWAVVGGYSWCAVW